MKYNPLAYGLTYKSLENDPTLEQHRTDLIKIAARLLDKAHMIRYDEATGTFHATDLGRTASHFYIKYDTIEMFNQKLKEHMNDKELLAMTAECSEFQQLKVRDEEMQELDNLHEECVLPVMGGVESTHGKVNCLIQAYVLRARIEGFSLVSDLAYVSQNVTRIVRALFEVVVKRGWALLSGRLLNICKSIEKQLWYFQSPMRQFESQLSYEILVKIEENKLSLDKMREMSAKELGILLRHAKMGDRVKQCLTYLPAIEIDTSLHPITRTVLRVRVVLTADFVWNDKLHGQSEFFWVWIEDPVHDHIYHHEYFCMQKKFVKNKEPQLIVFTIPIFEPLPSQYIVRVMSDRWLGVEFSHSISFKHLILPEQHPPHTELLDLDPLPVTALNNSAYESLYSFSHFNPIQTQIFHCFYHTNHNCLLGAPTGSGKTIAAELAMFRVFNQGNKKIVYIAPLKGWSKD
jgi:activating signal cointegrator complex subunit 3